MGAGRWEEGSKGAHAHVRVSTKVILRLRLRTDTLSLPLHSVAQSKSQGQPSSREDETDRLLMEGAEQSNRKLLIQKEA